MKLLEGSQVRDALDAFVEHHGGSRECIVSIAPPSDGSQEFSMTIEKADDGAVAAEPRLFKVDRPGELKRWIETDIAGEISV